MKYIVMFICCLFITCTNRSKLYFDTNSDYFDVVYNKDDITITEVYRGEIFESRYSLKNGEYIDVSENRVFLSTKQQYEILIDRNYVDYKKQLWMQIYKLKSSFLYSDFGKNADVFVTEFYAKKHNRKDVLRAYYYDKNYKILKIVVSENTEFNLNN